MIAAMILERMFDWCVVWCLGSGRCLYSSSLFVGVCGFGDIFREDESIGHVVLFLVRVEYFLLPPPDQLLRKGDGCFFIFSVICMRYVKEFPYGKGGNHSMLVPEKTLQCGRNDFHFRLHLYLDGDDIAPVYEFFFLRAKIIHEVSIFRFHRTMHPSLQIKYPKRVVGFRRRVVYRPT